MENEEKKGDGKSDDFGKDLLTYFGVAFMMSIALLVLWDLYLRHYFGFNYEKRGQFADGFGPVGIVLSGMAFFGLMLSIAIQSRDLRTQTKALSQQIAEFKEQKEEMRKSAEAQDRLAAAQEAANILAKATLQMNAIRQRIQFNSVAYQGANADDRAQGIEIIRKQIAALDELAGIQGATPPD